MIGPATSLVRRGSGVLVLALVGVLLAADEGQSAHARFTDSPIAKDFTLVAAPVRWEIETGVVVDGWAYNGMVPGPELRVREGELVRVHLHNDLPVPTTIHWHGIDVPLQQDGVPGLSQDPVPSGGDFIYEFVATNPGTRWYHSHVDSNAQLELGLYGAFIVEPRVLESIRYDREFTYLLDEKALDFTPEVARGTSKLSSAERGNGRGGQLQYDLFLMNGKAGDAIPHLSIASGERIRIRLINAGNLVHAMHLHGQSFSIVATDGNPVPDSQRWLKDTVLIGPGERYDLEVVGSNPGVWMFHCHMPNHQENGMMTTLDYDDFTPLPAHDHSLSPVATVSENSIRVVDNRFEPSSVSVPVGATVIWTNAGINRHTATGFDGTYDTGDIAPGTALSLTFSQPGTYRYYCRQHLLGGMLGVIQVG